MSDSGFEKFWFGKIDITLEYKQFTFDLLVHPNKIVCFLSLA